MLIWQNDGSELFYRTRSSRCRFSLTQPWGRDRQVVRVGRLGRVGSRKTRRWSRRWTCSGRQGAQEYDERVKTAKEIWKILAEETYSIGTVGLSPATLGVRVVKNNVGNSPARQMNAKHCRTPGSSHPATFFFKS